MNYGLEGVPNGIQIWRIDINEKNQVEPITIVKHIEIDQESWVPYDFVWETDNSIILKVVTVEIFLNASGQPKDNDFYFLRLNL